MYARWGLKDGDNNVYTTVQIGNQVWTVENLRTTRYADSTAIPNVTGNSEWEALSTPAYCWYNNDLDQGYGALYNRWVVGTLNAKKQPFQTGQHCLTILEEQVQLVAR